MAEKSAAPMRWTHSLRLRLGLFSAFVFLAVGALALWGNYRYVHQPLAQEEHALLQAHQQALVAELSAPLATAERLSLSLAGVADAHWGDAKLLREVALSILNRIDAGDALVAAGIWPAPNAFNSRSARSSFYWTIDADGPRFHGDYNNPANISYHGEPWYSPLPFYSGAGCFWTSRYMEPFLQRPVISCATPLLRNEQFAGVASVVLDLARLQPQTSGTELPFYLLLDRDTQILSSAGLAVDRQDNIADLAKSDTRFGAVAVRLHEAGEAQVRQARATGALGEEAVQTLINASRQLPRLRAERLLATLGGTRGTPPAESFTGADWGAGIAVQLQPLPAGDWTLLVGRQTRPALGGIPLTVWFAAASTAGMLLLATLLISAAQRAMLLAPLSRMLEQMRRPAEDSHVEVHGHGELGALAQLINQRHDTIRALTTRIRAARYDPASGRPLRSVTPDVEASPAGSGWAVLDTFPDAVVVCDEEGRLQHLNKPAEALCGWNLAQARGLAFDEVFPLLERSGKTRLPDLARSAIRGGRRTERPIEALFKTRSGHELPMAVSSAPLAGEMAGAVLVIHDPRNLPQDAAPSDRTQVRDPLTGSLNRQSFDAELASRCEATRLAGASSFFLLYADIDGMQRINDACGTAGGDEFLRQFARLMQNDVGSANPVYRLHADKFAALLATPEKAEAQVAAELLRADVQSWGFTWKNQTLEVGLTLSLIEVDRSSGRPVDILRIADQVCQQAKSEGRGRVVSGLARPPRGQQRDDRQWLDHIKRGLAQDRFHLSTQQLRRLQRGGESGEVFATLLLLEDEEGFWSGTDAFMPAAERHGLSPQLDRWMLEQVFSRLAGDSALLGELEFCMLPLSAGSLQLPSFLDFILERFKESSVPPGKICFDLRETDVNARLSTARDFITALSRAGVRFCLSEVSTRPASYSLIKELPVSLIRIDPLLTRRVVSDQVDRLAVESLHKIARTLGKRSIATGIQDAEMLRVIQGIGIDFAQGNAVARATPLLFQVQA